MLDAIVWIERITAGATAASYLADRPMRDAVERNLERLSEASRHLPEALLRRHEAIPWRQVRDLGNVLRHGYHAVEDQQVWVIVVRDLPRLRVSVEAMLVELGAGEPS
ncbi:MAG: HepT-like ribonuclease domain-containing protein [Geminicoccaceae bacterium]